LDPILTVTEQVAAAQNTFEPAEEEFHGPAVAIGQRYQVGVQLQMIGDQHHLDWGAVGVAFVRGDADDP
jgi:hypothetical protein